MNREYHKWYSERLGRDMELLVFGHGGEPVLFFPPRMGRFYDYENWKVIAALQNRITAGELQIFCVDSVDTESFYNQGVHPMVRIKRYLQYEDYILNEVVPFIHEKNGNDDLIAAGCSMGAYHAANVALKHPQLFKKAVCMSGRYDLTEQIQFFTNLFDGYHDEDIYFNMPRQYVANLHDGPELTAMQKLKIVLVIGETDPFIDNNRELSKLLTEKGITNELYIWDNYAHKARYWRQMVQHYL